MLVNSHLIFGTTMGNSTVTPSAMPALLSLLVLLMMSIDAGAQTYPTKVIRMIVPGPAGGGTDIIARIIGEGLTKQLGQTVIIDNRGGGAGMIGTEVVAKAPPDGYTLLMAYAGVLTVTPALFKTMPYDAIKDFAPVGMVAHVPAVLVVHPSLPVHSVAELVKLAKSSRER